jgi:hypothetical protein
MPGMPRLARIAVIFLVAATWAAVASLPFLSETWTQLVRARAMASWVDAFDPARVPLRPLQHLAFRGLANAGDVSEGVALLPAFALHLASCFLAAALARRFGAGRRGAAVTALLLAVAPTAKSLAWFAAISAPGRVACSLLALVLHARWQERRRGLDFAGCLLAQLLALGFHQSAIVLPALLLLSSLARGRGLRDPLAFACGALVGGYVLIWLGTPREYVGVASSARIVGAHAAKVLLWPLPEPVRLLVTDACRGRFGGAGLAAGGAALLAWVAAIAGLFWRGGRAARFVVPCVLLDMLLVVAVASPLQRYAYLSLALIAVGLGAWVDTSAAPRRALAVALLIGLTFAWDEVQDLRELREAGAVAETILAQASELRARYGPERSITLVDLPDAWGREEDIAVFNWGFPAAAAERGADGPWTLLRTGDSITTTDSSLVPEREIAARAQRPDEILLRFDEAAGRLQPLGPAAGMGGPP